MAKPAALNFLLGFVGAIVGGALGYFLFAWLVRQGFYALALPGALVGLGCGMLSGIRSNTLGAVCAVSAVLLALFAEWSAFPFNADDSLGFFLSHLGELRPITWIMVGLSGLFGFWFGKGREGGAWNRGG